MEGRRFLGGVMVSLAWLCAQPAYAHFKLLRPASWLNEDSTGGPQKGSPCGPGDGQPFPASGAMSTFQAGDTITVQWQETVYHPGYFRISIAPTEAAAATTEDFPDPALTDPQGCYYDHAGVQTGPHDHVLADGLYMASGQGANRSLAEDVKLPDTPCDRCTLQVVQVMEGHGGASCFYFHCAELTIVPAGSVVAGTGAGAGAKVPASSSSDSDGCSVTGVGARSGHTAAWLLLAFAALLHRRRR